MKIIKSRGFIIKGTEFGESHKIITLLSDTLGKIQIIAYGVRKTNSSYGSAFELLNEVSIVLRSSKKGDIYYIKEVSIITSLNSIKGDLSIIYQLYNIAEFIDCFIQPGCCNKSIYNLLSDSLTFCVKSINNSYEFIRSFQLKLLKKLGFLPDLLTCSQCGKLIMSKMNKVYTSTNSGWIFCYECSNKKNDKEISIGAYRFLLDLVNLEIDKVSQLKMNNFFKKEISLSIEKLIASILGHYLKSSKWV